jgi:hypothetical protein
MGSARARDVDARASSPHVHPFEFGQAKLADHFAAHLAADRLPTDLRDVAIHDVS